MNSLYVISTIDSGGCPTYFKNFDGIQAFWTPHKTQAMLFNSKEEAKSHAKSVWINGGWEHFNYHAPVFAASDLFNVTMYEWVGGTNNLPSWFKHNEEINLTSDKLMELYNTGNNIMLCHAGNGAHILFVDSKRFTQR